MGARATLEGKLNKTKTNRKQQPQQQPMKKSPGFSPKSQEFLEAVRYGKFPLALELLKDPTVDINFCDENHFRCTPLSRCCWERKLEAVEFLLQLEGIDVNNGDGRGSSPFFLACVSCHVGVMKTLLRDPRVDVTLPKHDNPLRVTCRGNDVEATKLLLADKRIDVNRPAPTVGTPINLAARLGHLDVVKLLLADEREIDCEHRAPTDRFTPIETALSTAKRIEETMGDELDEPQLSRWEKRERCLQIASLLQEYRENPDSVRRRLRRELGSDEELSGELFALMVLLSDGYLRLQEVQGREGMVNKAWRFFKMASELPMDLQMVLCNRRFGLGAPIIKMFFSEKGFKKFAPMW